MHERGLRRLEDGAAVAARPEWLLRVALDSQPAPEGRRTAGQLRGAGRPRMRPVIRLRAMAPRGLRDSTHIESGDVPRGHRREVTVAIFSPNGWNATTRAGIGFDVMVTPGMDIRSCGHIPQVSSRPGGPPPATRRADCDIGAPRRGDEAGGLRPRGSGDFAGVWSSSRTRARPSPLSSLPCVDQSPTYERRRRRADLLDKPHA